MAEFVVDSSVWVAAYVPVDANHLRAQQFVDEVMQEPNTCHLSRLVLPVVCAAIIRRIARLDLVMRARQSFVDWEQQGLVRWYDLDGQRMNQAVSTAIRYRLRGADAIIVALADELNAPVFTIDGEILERYPKAQLP